MKKIILLSVLSCTILITACKISAPKLDGQSDICKAFLICLNQNQSNPDKSVCQPLGQACANLAVMTACGGTIALEVNELKFLKCVTNLK
jgi:hypothetical protein